MTAPFCLPPVPVGQQAPPARDAASAARARRVARGSLLLTTGTGCSPHETSLRQDPCSWNEAIGQDISVYLTAPFQPALLRAGRGSADISKEKLPALQSQNPVLDVHCEP